MDIETLIFAVIAILVLARLWSLFGRRNDDDPQRRNPFVLPTPRSQDEESLPRLTSAGPDRSTISFASRTAPTSLAGGLEQIKLLDPTFDEKQFLQGARGAFTGIVEDFAKGEMARITKLLGPDVLALFQRAVTARQAAGHTMESRILRICEAECIAARVEGQRGLITVRFVSDQENVLRDSTHNILSGETGKVEELTDVWVFCRDASSADPNWILVETKS